MSDEELCARFGTTLAQVEEDARRYEDGDLDGLAFGPAVDGRPGVAMRTSSVEFYDFELAAIDRAARREGLTRSAFIRRACENELVEMA